VSGKSGTRREARGAAEDAEPGSGGSWDSGRENKSDSLRDVTLLPSANSATPRDRIWCPGKPGTLREARGAAEEAERDFKGWIYLCVLDIRGPVNEARFPAIVAVSRSRFFKASAGDHLLAGTTAEKSVDAMKELDEITADVVDSAFRIHRDLGPGLLESVYEVVLCRSLEKQGHLVERQRCVRFEFDGMVFADGFRVDLQVDQRVLVEIKSVECLAPVHAKQLLTYLRLMNLPVGLLINFGSCTLKEGLHRIVNKLTSTDSPALRVNRSPSTPM
jgi:GxxExxY protein